MKLLRSKVLRRALALSLVAVIGFGALGAAFYFRFHPSPKQFDFPKPTNLAESRRQDLEALGQLFAVDRSFSPQAVVRFEEERLQLGQRAGSLSDEEFEMQVSRLVALGGNGHTSVVSRAKRLNMVPMRLAWFAEGLFVTRARDEYARHVGSDVVAINGRSPKDLLAEFRPFLSGTLERMKAMSPTLLQSPGALRGMGLSNDAAAANYTLRSQTGEIVTLRLVGEPPGKKVAYTEPGRNYSPLAEADVDAWHGLFSSSGMPLSLQNPDASAFIQRIDDGRALYVHLNATMGDERGDLSPQLDGALDAIDPGSLRYMIVDLRFNGGGNYLETLEFTKRIPQTLARDGRLYILTDAGTFSAAIVTAARAKFFSGPKAVILGERVGDTEQFWAESGQPLVLPNSRIAINGATGWHDWANGCSVASLGRCFWLNLLYDVPAGSLDPESVVAWRFSDYARGVDTLMELVIARAREETAPSQATSKGAGVLNVALLTVR